MESKKVLSALCYFSIFFAGFIFPLVVFFASSDSSTKKHAKKAFLSHIIPAIPLPFLIFTILYEANKGPNAIPIYTIIIICFMVLVSIIVVVWNIVKGVKVFNEN